MALAQPAAKERQGHDSSAKAFDNGPGVDEDETGNPVEFDVSR
jgi:hypothetical protein